MSQTDFRIACFGAGYFSAFQFDAWKRINGAELIAVADLDIKKAKSQDVLAFDNLETMLSQSNTDILDIITPPHTHLDAVKTALKFGLKAIICQKPFCATMAEAKEAAECAEKAGIPLIIHENFRFQPWFRVIAQAMDVGKIGQVHLATFRLRTGDGQGQNAYMARQPYFQKMERFLIHETGVHYIDVFRFLLGDVASVYADLRQMNPVIAGEDAGHVIFEFKNGARALFDGDRNLDHVTDNPRRTFGEALIEGTKGSIMLEGDGSVNFRSFGTSDCEILLAPQDWPGFAGDCVYALQKHVVDALASDGEIENLATDYLKVIAIEDAIYRSASQGSKQVI